MPRSNVLVSAVVLNTLAALVWLGFAALLLLVLVLPGKAVGTGAFGLVLFPLIAGLRVWTSVGMWRREPWAYRRSLRSNLIGGGFCLLSAFSGNHIIALLVPIEALAALFTYLSREEFSAPGEGARPLAPPPAAQ